MLNFNHFKKWIVLKLLQNKFEQMNLVQCLFYLWVEYCTKNPSINANFSGLTRYPKKSKTSDRYKELESNFLQDANKVCDIFCYDDKQSNMKFRMAWEWHLVNGDHVFLKIKKQNTMVNVWQHPQIQEENY